MEKVINLGLVALMSRWSLVVNHGAQVGAWIEGVMVQFGLWVFFGSTMDVNVVVGGCGASLSLSVVICGCGGFG